MPEEHSVMGRAALGCRRKYCLRKLCLKDVEWGRPREQHEWWPCDRKKQSLFKEVEERRPGWLEGQRWVRRWGQWRRQAGARPSFYDPTKPSQVSESFASHFYLISQYVFLPLDSSQNEKQKNQNMEAYWPAWPRTAPVQGLSLNNSRAADTGRAQHSGILPIWVNEWTTEWINEWPSD